MGRFLSPDDGSDQDAGNPESWNLYSYVHNNPLSNVDPDGHDCIQSQMTGDGRNSLVAVSIPETMCVDGYYVPGYVTNLGYNPNTGAVTYNFISYDTGEIEPRRLYLVTATADSSTLQDL